VQREMESYRSPLESAQPCASPAPPTSALAPGSRCIERSMDASSVGLFRSRLDGPRVAAVEPGDGHFDFHFAPRYRAFIFGSERIAAEIPGYFERNVIPVHFAIGNWRGCGRRRCVPATS